MSIEDNKALYLRYTRLLAKPDLIDEVVAPDFVGHDLPPSLPAGIEGLRAFRRFVMAALQDQTSEIEQVVAEGDKVAARIRVEGTHRGDFMGFKASGKRFTTYVFEIVRIANGKIAERWALFDRDTLIQQLDAPPSSSDH